ncbi:MAG: esterase-like activity of phytase family protein [Bdellovibrionales bacterium]|nr:esterase-like activity of phytase family protein [Bdellovibrionales bacterium]
MKENRKFVHPLIFSLLTACAGRIALGPQAFVNKIPIQNADLEAKSDQDSLNFGGFSSLYYSVEESTSSKSVLYTITDRGPNLESQAGPGGVGTERPFLLPDFTPRILKLTLDLEKGRAVAESPILIRRPNGLPISGRPHHQNSNHQENPNLSPLEIPVDKQGHPLPYDPWGLDTESLVRDKKGDFWVGEEYGPSLVRIDSRGIILKRWSPELSSQSEAYQGELPRFLAKRKVNRGFEALAWNKAGNLLAFLQSPLPDSEITRLIAILEFDPIKEESVGLYFYRAHENGGKIGDATLGPNGEILVIEQNGEVGRNAWQKIYGISLTHATNDLAKALNMGFSYVPGKEIKEVEKREVANLTKLGLESFAKLEGLTFTPSNKLVLLNDNDFSLSQMEGNFLFLLGGLDFAH